MEKVITAVDETPEIAYLRECGETLFGAAWQTDMARELSTLRLANGGKPVDVATVRRWMRGAYQPQPWAWDLIDALMRERIQRLMHLRERMAVMPFWEKL